MVGRLLFIGNGDLLGTAGSLLHQQKYVFPMVFKGFSITVRFPKARNGNRGLHDLPPARVHGNARFTNGFREVQLRILRVPLGAASIPFPAVEPHHAQNVVLPMVFAWFRITVRFRGLFFFLEGQK